MTGGQLLARLADYRERALLVEGQAFETEAALVTRRDRRRDGRSVWTLLRKLDLHKAARGEAKLVIRSVGKTDPTARTFPFYTALTSEAKPYEDAAGKPTSRRYYRPGRQVRLRVPTGTIPKVIVLPVDAVVREDPDAFVFRQNGDAYDRKAVVIVAEDRLNVADRVGQRHRDRCLHSREQRGGRLNAALEGCFRRRALAAPGARRAIGTPTAPSSEKD